MKLSIIVPVFNEDKTIIAILKTVNSVDYKIQSEIIIVDDGSTDETNKKLHEAKGIMKNIKIFSYKKNKGKGYATRVGIKKATGDILIVQDADMEYSPSDIPNLLKPILIGETKIVYGSRFLGECKNMIFPNLVANKILTHMTNILFGSKLTDMETGYKIIKREVLDSIILESDGFEMEAEITAKILKNNYKIVELPISYKARTKGEGKKISWIDGIKNLLVLLKIRLDL